MTDYSGYSCSYSRNKTMDKKNSSFSLNLPKPNELSLLAGTALFGSVVIIGIGIGAMIASQVFIGTVGLLSLVVMSERYPQVKYVIQRTNTMIDLIIFGGSVYAISALGVTLAGGITVMGLGYTCLVAPIYRKQYRQNKKTTQEE